MAQFLSYEEIVSFYVEFTKNIVHNVITVSKSGE